MVKLGGEACVLLCLFYYLFIHCLFVCLLFNFFKGAVCWFMHQLCGLAPLGFGGGGISVFWWVSSGLICSPLDSMQDLMKSLPSFLIYCCYCLQLFILLLSIVSMDKPAYWFGMKLGVLVSTQGIIRHLLHIPLEGCK